MVISPEVRPRVSVTTDYEIPAKSTTDTEWTSDRMESGFDNSIGYALGVLALLVIGYFAYAYYGQNIGVPNITDQSTTTVAPPVVPAPSATSPVVPAPPPVTTITP